MPAPDVVDAAYEAAALEALLAAMEREPGRHIEVGLSALRDSYGDRDRVLLNFLRAGDVKYDIQLAVRRLRATLDFRREMGLDAWNASGAGDSLQKAIDADVVREHWPFAYPGRATDGCVIQFARVANVDPKHLMSTFSEERLRQYIIMWYERAVQLQRESTEATGATCPGTYDVYDLSGLRLGQFDLRALRGISRVIKVGQTHWPENLRRSFIINTPSFIHGVWRIVRLAIHEKTQQKIVFSTTVPPELAATLGSEEAVADRATSHSAHGSHRALGAQGSTEIAGHCACALRWRPCLPASPSGARPPPRPPKSSPSPPRRLAAGGGAPAPRRAAAAAAAADGRAPPAAAVGQARAGSRSARARRRPRRRRRRPTARPPSSRRPHPDGSFGEEGLAAAARPLSRLSESMPRPQIAALSSFFLLSLA